MPLRASRRPVAAAALTALLFVLTACGTDSTGSPSGASTSSGATSSSTTAASSAACADAAALMSSLQALTTINPLQDGLDSVNAAVGKVKSSLDAAAASASVALKPNVDQVKAAFDQLQTATTGLTADNLRAKAPAIVVALQQLGVATTALATALKQSCPAS